MSVTGRITPCMSCGHDPMNPLWQSHAPSMTLPIVIGDKTFNVVLDVGIYITNLEEKIKELTATPEPVYACWVNVEALLDITTKLLDTWQKFQAGDISKDGVEDSFKQYVTQCHPVAVSEVLKAVLALERMYRDAKREVKHWKGNHDNQVQRARFLIEREDLPVERVRAYDQMLELQQENNQLKAQVSALRRYADWSPVIETCENGHKFAKLEDHPKRDGFARCPHCLAVGLDAYRNNP